MSGIVGSRASYAERLEAEARARGMRVHTRTHDWGQVVDIEIEHARTVHRVHFTRDWTTDDIDGAHGITYRAMLRWSTDVCPVCAASMGG